MKMRAALACACVVLAGTPLRAQESQSAEESAERHEVLFREAVEALRLNRYEAASARFEESLNLHPQAKAACNLGITYDRWGGHEAEARDAYVRCAELDDSGRFRDHALSRAAALRDVLSQRPPEPPEEPDETPAEPLPDPPTDVTLERPGGTEDPIRVPVQPPPRGLLWAGIGLSVAGFVVLGSAIAPSSSAQADADTILLKYPDRRISPEDAQYLGINEDFERKRRIAVGLFVAGGGIAAMGIAAIIADVVRHRRSTARVQAGVAPTDGGAMVHGRIEF